MLENIRLIGTHYSAVDESRRLYLPDKMVGSLKEESQIAYMLWPQEAMDMKYLGIVMAAMDRRQEIADYVTKMRITENVARREGVTSEQRISLGVLSDHILEAGVGEVMMIGFGHHAKIFSKNAGERYNRIRGEKLRNHLATGQGIKLFYKA
ncbi:MAG TPA: hypothetical protein VJB12_02380 [Candidatus Nanoarchaeia archaeon]|nr:hypothetical protein [Candidatus Nanoarchaeia archaeon]